jgi:hypothetical protein
LLADSSVSTLASALNKPVNIKPLIKNALASVLKNTTEINKIKKTFPMLAFK